MIIGFHGCKGTGKDTAAQFLIDHLEFQKVAFADKLKEAVANLFDITLTEVDTWKGMNDVNLSIEKNRGVTRPVRMSFRELLQRFGTEMGRETFGKNFWVDQWEDSLYRNSIQDDNIVVTDVRFKNEAEKIQHMGGTVVRIIRPGYEPDGHESEEPLPDILIDVELNNSGTIMDLHLDVHELILQLTRGE